MGKGYPYGPLGLAQGRSVAHVQPKTNTASAHPNYHSNAASFILLAYPFC